MFFSRTDEFGGTQSTLISLRKTLGVLNCNSTIRKKHWLKKKTQTALLNQPHLMFLCHFLFVFFKWVQMNNGTLGWDLKSFLLFYKRSLSRKEAKRKKLHSTKCHQSDWRRPFPSPSTPSLPLVHCCCLFPLSALSPTPLGNWLKQNVTIMPCSLPLQLFIN